MAYMNLFSLPVINKKSINHLNHPIPRIHGFWQPAAVWFSITGLFVIAGHSLSATFVREMIDSGQDSSQSSNTKSMKCLNGMR